MRVVTLSYMREHPKSPTYSIGSPVSKNGLGLDNPQETLGLLIRRILRDYTLSSRYELNRARFSYWMKIESTPA